MSLILNIDTALDTASVCLAGNGQPLQLSFNKDQKDHAAWMHNSIAEMMENSGHTMKDLDAVAVSIGPGSYTGLRVGLAAAKGFCYALNIPLITISTLKLIAFAAKEEATDLICPMIDARRMEVFMTLYDRNFVEKIPHKAMILDERTVTDLFTFGHILFCGNAINKIDTFIINKPASFSKLTANASHLAQLSVSDLINKQFADLAYCEPFYLKEFYSPQKS